MPFFEKHGLTLHFEQFGSRADPPIVLIHGLGCQLIEWPANFIRALAAGGYRVIAPDNRDMGRSTHLSHLDELTPKVMDMLVEETTQPVESLYSLSDMADDVVALIDYLGQSGAHIVGLSMGGMIAQRLAIAHQARCFSLTCLMTSANLPAMEDLDLEASMVFFAEPESDEFDALVAQREAGWNAVGGPHFVSSECGMGRFASDAVKRCTNRNGFARQFHAIRSDPDRVPLLREIDVPSLVIHGEVDPLVPLSSGELLADSIPNAELETIGHMGHDLPEPLIPTLAEHILEHLDSVEVER